MGTLAPTAEPLLPVGSVFGLSLLGRYIGMMAVRIVTMEKLVMLNKLV